MKNKKAQEEILGFALIIIIVSVVILVFLGISLNKSNKQSIESYEVENFIQTFLQYTTDCAESENDYFDIQDLIFECNNFGSCLDDRLTCDVLNETLKEILDGSWKIGEEYLVKGYEMFINSNEEPLIYFIEGNITNNYKGASQDFSKRGYSIDITFTAYY